MTEFFPIFQKIKDEIDKANKVIVITHQNPDGDALGSLLGMHHYLRLVKTDHTLFCLTETPDYLKFLPDTEHISNDENHLMKNEHDLIIILDSGDLQYAGVDKHFRKIKGLPVVINIDHHPTNQYYGHINLVHPQASSTSEIIFHFLDYFRLPITKEVATSLLTGILTDTGSFSNLATTPSSMEVSSKLLTSGARVREIITNTFRNKSLSQLQLWGRALSRLKHNKKTGIVTTVLTQQDFDELGIDDESGEGFANFLNNVEQARAIIVLREKLDGTIKGSLRTTQPDVDVSKIAEFFGGGGHKKAAGFTIKGQLKETPQGWQVVKK
ncbi:bifunctional oligoribonuclease/PAP phosphatase NrnA [Patescibacteria group bacterium]|nr:bifunctional oligoribonuclease/PAP phosphatase NrnA [Patescibacteria group bacterium]